MSPHHATDLAATHLFLKALRAPPFGLHRKTARPVRQSAHDLLKLLDAAEPFGDFSNNLVVNAEHDWITGGLQIEHRMSKQIPADCLHCVLAPLAPVGLLPLPLLGHGIDALEGHGPPWPETRLSQFVSRVCIGQKPAGREP
jgi:hypothetical protein